MNNYQDWFNRQPKSTQVWLKNQAIWHDSDMLKIAFASLLLGVLIGGML